MTQYHSSLRTSSIPADLREQLAGHGIFPVDLVLYINSLCNLRCRHCYIGDDLLNAAQSYSAEEIADFVAQFPRLERTTVLGGEPMLHRQINDILHTLLSKPVEELRVTTNLTRLNQFDLDRFAGENITICVSLDGHTAQLHNYIRGERAFENTIQNLRRMIRANYSLEVTMTVTTHNVDFFLDMVNLCRELGIRRLNLHRMSLHGNALNNSHLLVPPSRWVTLCDSIACSSKAPVGRSYGDFCGQASNHSDTLLVRYPRLFVTRDHYDHLCQTGRYHPHASGSFYAFGKGHRLVLYPNRTLYMSSEAFGTESHIGRMRNGVFEFNYSKSNEHSLFNTPDASISRMNERQSGDVQYPCVLSVSFKEVAWL